MKALRRLDLPYLAAAVLLLALVCYTGAFFLESASAACVAVLREETLLDGETVRGVVLRCEQPVFGSAEAVTAQEGKRVGSGGLIAAAARRSLPERLLELHAMQLELLRLRCLYSAQNACVVLSDAPGPTPRALDALPSLPEERTSIFDVEKMSKKLVSAYVELLESSFVTAPRAGIFSSFTDGLETEDASLPDEAKDYGRACVGKIVFSDDWYLEADIKRKGVSVGDSVKLVLGERSFEAQLVSLDKGHARFRCTEGVESVLSLRRESVRIIYSELSGFSVPKSSVKYGADGEAYVTVRHGAGDETVKIKLVYESGDKLLIRSAEPDALRAGAEIYIYPGDKVS